MKSNICTLFLFWSMLLFCACSSNVQLKYGDYFEEIDGLKLNYSIRGKGPVMLVGHVSSGKIGYQLSLQPLEEFFTMVYYEPRGTGQSEIPSSLEGYQQEFIVEEIEALRKYLAVDQIWLFGHSDQSAIALQYALKFPQQTAGLILSGTSWIGSQQESYERRAKSEKERAETSPWFAQVIQDWDDMIQYNRSTAPDGRDLTDAPIKWWCYDEISAEKVIPIVREIAKAGRRKSINGEFVIESETERQRYLNAQQQFSSIQNNILILNGIDDTNNPPQYAKQLHQNLPNSTLLLIDKAGHFPWIENSEESFQSIENWFNSLN